MYFVAFDVETGRIIGFYNITVNTNIPENTIAITEEQWQQALENSDKWIVENGQLAAVLE